MVTCVSCLEPKKPQILTHTTALTFCFDAKKRERARLVLPAVRRKQDRVQTRGQPCSSKTCQLYIKVHDNVIDFIGNQF
jgi:hypothetical protein